MDILDSRDCERVSDWLKGYPNIEIVSRDGSIGYRKAIDEAFGDVIQISDGFHLIKGLSDGCKEYIQERFGTSIVIEECETKGQSDGIEEIKGKALSEKEESKLRLAEEIRRLNKEGYSKRVISRMLNLSRETVRKYLNSSSVENGNKGRRNPSKLDPYRKQIERLVDERRLIKNIFEALKSMGYTGSYSNVGICVSKMKKECGIDVVKDGVVRISKKSLIDLLYKPIEKVKGLTKELYEKIIEKYPIMGQMLELIGKFKEVLKSKEVEMLEEWMVKANSLKIREIDRFVKGIKRNIEAVRNAIRYEYNNGLAEGSVNKLKVIKRIIYGRSKFELLKAKVLLLEGAK